MNFSLQTEEFRRAVESACLAVERKTTIPILTHVLIEAREGGTVVVSGTDLEVAVRCRVTGTVDEPGSVTVPAKALANWLKGMKLGRVTATCEITTRTIDPPLPKNGEEPAEPTVVTDYKPVAFSVSSGQRFTLTPMGPESYPELPKPAEVLGTILAADLDKLINRTAYAISAEESRFPLNGALFEFKGQKARMVATDGHRMSVATVLPFQSDGEGVTLIPRLALTIFDRLKVISNQPVTLAHDENHLAFYCGDTMLLTLKLKGNFPDYRRVLPKDNGDVLTVDRKAFIATLTRAAKAADQRSRHVKFTLNESVRVTVLNDGQSFDEAIPCEWSGPTDATVGFNVDYLLDFLRSADAETMALAFGAWKYPKVDENAENKTPPDPPMCDGAVLQYFPSVPDYVAVLMPMRV